MEKEIKTVANLTQLDIAEFRPLAAQVPHATDGTALPARGGQPGAPRA